MWERKYQRRFTYISYPSSSSSQLSFIFILLSSIFIDCFYFRENLVVSTHGPDISELTQESGKTRPTPSPILVSSTVCPSSSSPSLSSLLLPFLLFFLFLTWKKVHDYPLAVCESGTVDVEHDLELTTFLSSPPTSNGETYSVKYNKNQVIREVEEREEETRERRVWWWGEMESKREKRVHWRKRVELTCA